MCSCISRPCTTLGEPAGVVRQAVEQRGLAPASLMSTGVR